MLNPWLAFEIAFLHGENRHLAPSKSSTPTAFFPSKITRVTLESVLIVKFSSFVARYADAAVIRNP
jgi:hypothetical protein